MNRALNITLAVVFGFVGVGVIWALASSRSGETAQPPAPAVLAPPPAPLPPHQLTGIAMWTLQRGGLEICVRERLHNCTVRFGDPNTERTLTWPTTTIEPVASCDTQGQAALDACRTEHPGDRDAQAGCLLPRGMLMPDIAATVDPRDEQLPSGTTDVRCDEGEARRSTIR